VTGWWRRNRLALVATLVLAPLTVGVVFQKEWGGFSAGRPVDAVDAAVGEAAAFGGSGWRVTGSERVRWSSDPGVEQDLPPGTDLVVVRLEVTPDELDAEGRSTGCLMQLDEGRGARVSRTWEPASAYLDLDFEPGVSSGCESERTGPYEATARFLVPVDAGEDADLRLGIQVADELPRFLRVTL
jgi:hypothetical protein